MQTLSSNLRPAWSLFEGFPVWRVQGLDGSALRSTVNVLNTRVGCSYGSRILMRRVLRVLSRSESSLATASEQKSDVGYRITTLAWPAEGARKTGSPSLNRAWDDHHHKHLHRARERQTCPADVVRILDQLEGSLALRSTGGRAPEVRAWGALAQRPGVSASSSSKHHSSKLSRCIRITVNVDQKES